MRQDEQRGLTKVAKAYAGGDVDGAIHEVLSTYKNDVREAGACLADVAKILAHGRREHPGPFHGVDENLAVGLLAVLAQEGDKSLAATIIGLALGEAAKYSWNNKCQPHQYVKGGYPVFMTGEDARCGVCVPSVAEAPTDDEPEQEQEPEQEKEPEVEATRIGMGAGALEALAGMDEKTAHNVKMFLAAISTLAAPKKDKVEARDLINAFVGGHIDQLVDVVRAIAEGMRAMDKAGVKGPVCGLTEPDALALLGQLLDLSKPALAATVFGVATAHGSLVAGAGQLRQLGLPDQRRGQRPAALMERLLAAGKGKGKGKS